MRVSRKIALILTPSLSDGSYSFVSWQPFGSDISALKSAAQLALNDTKSTWAQSLSTALGHERITKLPAPLLLHDSRVAGATYHHGADHSHAIIGPLSSVMRVASLSENEREVITQFARLQVTKGYVCYGVAQGHSKSDITSLQQLSGVHRLDFMGVVVVEPQLYPNTFHRLALIKDQFDAVHYVSSGDAYYVNAIAVRAHLLSPSQDILTTLDPTIDHESCTAVLPKRAYDLVVKSKKYSHVFDTRLS